MRFRESTWLTETRRRSAREPDVGESDIPVVMIGDIRREQAAMNGLEVVSRWLNGEKPDLPVWCVQWK